MKIEWMTLPDWMALTPDEHHRLALYLQEHNAELGIDIDGSHTKGRKLQWNRDPDEFDTQEYIADMSLGGKRYRERR